METGAGSGGRRACTPVGTWIGRKSVVHERETLVEIVGGAFFLVIRYILRLYCVETKKKQAEHTKQTYMDVSGGEVSGF